MTPEEIARALPVKPEKVIEWEDGESHPTFKQAQKWAALTHVPFGFLFLQAPPEEELPLPDLRTVGDQAPHKPSVNLIDIVKEVIRKQSWYLDYLKDHEYSALPFVGRFSVAATVREVVDDIRHTLAIPALQQRPTHDEYLRLLITAAERNGILVMRSGIVGSNTHRKLDVSEFRGFAISDRMAPVVFINSADAPTARLFTLVHELAHIWIGTSGISSVAVNSNRREESFCNAVAGEFLAPEVEFREHWSNDAFWRDNLSVLASYFRVSRLVIARRACDLHIITSEDYWAYYHAELQAYRDKESAGGNYYASAGAKNSLRFSQALLAETFGGNVLLRDAAKLLGLQPSKIKSYANRLTNEASTRL
ncbi:ImmA/IrrE family metallo-endopeptidase [Chitinolyticbacter meiyuanensis]|uniref:ImmA/IrrE family metallo-endopeptidase n=1 Tax=Chitinolyticbacter meiyuanensis TaxID=682798 RepID=UPI001C9E3FE7|nr:ImmA/IrrE family metallo-endopeptidase [Chitinolyticbacter meiyuanensis]